MDYRKELTSLSCSFMKSFKALWSNKTLRLVTIMDVIEGMAGTIWVGTITT
jgi:hypothetical protein